MHCITKMDIDEMCNDLVDKRVKDVLKEYIEIYNAEPTQENFETLISNCPMGFELTARITSNYLQEKSIYYQRKGHKTKAWKYYIGEQEKFPHFLELIKNGDNV